MELGFVSTMSDPRAQGFVKNVFTKLHSYLGLQINQPLCTLLFGICSASKLEENCNAIIGHIFHYYLSLLFLHHCFLLFNPFQWSIFNKKYYQNKILLLILISEHKYHLIEHKNRFVYKRTTISLRHLQITFSVDALCDF